MKKFAHINARSTEEAALYLGRYNGKANVIAGGTDLLGKMKDEILPTYPEALVNIKSISGLDHIEEQSGFLTLGALARLQDISKNSMIRERYAALGEAARRTASPHIREMGTLGGNLCQDIRCWYYRNPNNRFPCLRKGGGRCYALEGDNRYHSIFGGSVDQGCYAVHPSDTAPAVIALKGRIKTSKRTLNGEDFFEVGVKKTTVLEQDEIVTEIEIPTPAREAKSAFIKFAIRKTIDFPIVNCAAMIACDGGRVSEARICLNAVCVTPRRATEAEAVILGKEINAQNAESAGRAAVSDARPLKYNGYMVQIARALVKRCILACQ
jgi:xanthine dehydrogenase YagS FAD-binding subunit